jgi:hypothetical protein
MEIEDLKTTWASFDERLKKQEVLKESLIKEMIYKKTNKSLNILLCAELPDIPLFLLILPFIVYVYEKTGGKHLMWDCLFIFAGVICAALLPFIIYKAYVLTKIDLSDSIKNNLFYINKFNVLIKKEKVFFSFFLIPAILIFVVLSLYEAKVNTFVIWVSTGCLLIFTVLVAYWVYKKIYDKHIQSIQKSLETLKELDE